MADEERQSEEAPAVEEAPYTVEELKLVQEEFDVFRDNFPGISLSLGQFAALVRAVGSMIKHWGGAERLARGAESLEELQHPRKRR